MDTIEINTIADEIAGGAENRRLRDSENVVFSQRPSLGVSPYTGALIKCLRKIKPWDRREHLDFRENFSDAQAAIEAHEQNVQETEGKKEAETNDNDGYAPNAVSRLRRPWDVQFDVMLEGMTGNRFGGIIMCNLCKRTFRRESNFIENKKECVGRRIQQCTFHREAELASKVVYHGSLQH